MVLWKVSYADGLIGDRVKRHDVRGSRIETVSGNNIPRERRAGGLAACSLRAGRVIKLKPASAAEQAGEVATHHGLSRNSVEAAVADVLDAPAGRGDARSLVVAEDEEPILDNGSAHRPAELILLERTTGRSRLIEFPSIGIQLVILEYFPESAMNLVLTRLEIDVQNTSGPAAVLGVVTVSQNLELADRFDGGTHHEGRLIQEVNHVDIIVDAIQQEVVLTVRAHAIGGKAASNRIAGPGPRRENAGGSA